jgi:hypothetical protein
MGRKRKKGLWYKHDDLFSERGDSYEKRMEHHANVSKENK